MRTRHVYASSDEWVKVHRAGGSSRMGTPVSGSKGALELLLYWLLYSLLIVLFLFREFIVSLIQSLLTLSAIVAALMGIGYLAWRFRTEIWRGLSWVFVGLWRLATGIISLIKRACRRNRKTACKAGVLTRCATASQGASHGSSSTSDQASGTHGRIIQQK